MAIIFWLALRFLFCLFVFSRKKKAQIDNRARQLSIFSHKELFTQLRMFSPSFSIPSNPPPPSPPFPFV